MMQKHEDAVSGNCLTIADAIALLSTKLRDSGEARRLLKERAAMGDLQAFATRAYGPFDGISLNEHDWYASASGRLAGPVSERS